VKLRMFTVQPYPLQCESMEVVESVLVPGSSSAHLPELVIDGQHTSLEAAAASGYAIVEATQEERRVLGEHAFPLGMAYLIAIYQEKHEGGDQSIADELHCSLEGVATLREFLAPRRHPPLFSGEKSYFPSDVRRLAEVSQAHPAKLANFVNLARALDDWRANPPAPGTPVVMHLMYADGGGEWVQGVTE
jgi:hypothetical protein